MSAAKAAAGGLLTLALAGFAAAAQTTPDGSRQVVQAAPPATPPPAATPRTPPASAKSTTPSHADPAPAKQPAAATPQPKLPVSLEQALYLIRSTLLTLNDADRSGNYTVLRDLAAPSFAQRNTAADLSTIFADLRQRHFDLFVVAIAAPRLSDAPQLNAGGMLRLTGYFPTQPLQINFDLLFQNTGGEWKMYGIAVATPQAPPQQAAKPAGR